MKLMEIQEKARNEKCFRDSEWDLQFHVGGAGDAEQRAGGDRGKDVDPARA